MEPGTNYADTRYQLPRIDIQPRAETLVAVITLGRVGGLGCVAAPQDLEGNFVAPGACFGHCVEVDGYEVALGYTSTVNKPFGHFFVGDNGELFLNCDLVRRHCVARFLDCGV